MRDCSAPEELKRGFEKIGPWTNCTRAILNSSGPLGSTMILAALISTSCSDVHLLLFVRVVPSPALGAGP